MLDTKKEKTLVCLLLGCISILSFALASPYKTETWLQAIPPPPPQPPQSPPTAAPVAATVSPPFVAKPCSQIQWKKIVKRLTRGVWKEGVWSTNKKQKHGVGLSNSEARAILREKWVVFLGDSSLRMTADLMAGVVSGDLKTWPSAWNNHFFNHTVPGYYDYFFAGTRITFIWVARQELYNPPGSIPALIALTTQNIGRPDVLVMQQGYWWTPGVATHEPNSTDLPPAYDQVVGRFFKLVDDYLAAPEGGHSLPNYYKRPTYHIWMSMFQKEQKEERDIDTMGVDAAKVRNYAIFNRTALAVDAPCSVDACWKYGHAHPIGVVRDMEVELLLQAINSTDHCN